MRLKLTLFALSLALPAASEARVLCSPSATTCTFTEMPLYNQNDASIGSELLPNGPSKSALSGPTAAAMALQGVITEVSSPASIAEGSWIDSTFLKGFDQLTFKEKQGHQIRSMAAITGTSPTEGTNPSRVGSGVYGRAEDFAIAGGATTSFPVSFSNSTYVNYVKTDKSATVILFGHYTRTATTANGKTYYNYKRNGGHFVTVNGFSGNKLLLFDPWYGQRQEREVTIIKKGCADGVCQNLPSLSQRSLLSVSGNSFKFIDHHTRLWAE